MNKYIIEMAIPNGNFKVIKDGIELNDLKAIKFEASVDEIFVKLKLVYGIAHENKNLISSEDSKILRIETNGKHTNTFIYLNEERQKIVSKIKLQATGLENEVQLNYVLLKEQDQIGE